MDSSKELKPLRDAVQAALVTITRSVNTLANEDLQFQRTVHPSVATRLDQNTDRLLKLAGGVLKSAAKFTAQREPSLDDVDDVEIQWDGIVDVIDSLLEKSDTCLDEYTGLIKRKDAPTADAGRELKRPKPTTERLDWSMKRANILKPQNAFEKKTDNFESGPWKPPMTTKPHAQIPLETSLATFTNEEGHTQYNHPYEHEITNMQYPEQAFQQREPIKYLPIEKTEAIRVDSYEGVLEMLEELKKATEIAIDLEHHDFRTYTGLLSLMQISTREKDWIVDTLVPWRHKLEVLNEVFADPKIIKVLHGAFMDIIWLQRDLGLYVVGLFDTFYACDTLGYAGKSLAFLLKKFVDFDADKKYQLADWRIRPLPEEMLYYARSDTHYLLYIFDMLRNELAEFPAQNDMDGKPIDRVIQKSKEVSLQRYEHPFCDPETGVGNRGWFNTLIKSPSLYNGEQFAVYKAVHKWRDDVARRDDESPPYIMTQHILGDIARIMPADMKALWSLLGTSSRGLKLRLDGLFEVIQQARARGANGPTMMEFFRQSSAGTVQPSLGGKQVKASGVDDFEPLSIEELRSDRSQLWGNIALNSRLDGSSKAPPLNYQEMIPLYTFDFGAVKEELPKTREPPPRTLPKEDFDAAAAAVEAEGFTLKAGRKRKASDVDMEPTSEPESVSDVEMDESLAADHQPEAPDAEGDDAKALKKARKRANRATRKEFNKAQLEVQELMKQGNVQAAKKLKTESKEALKAAKRAAKKELQQQRQQQQQQQTSSAGSPSAAEQTASSEQATEEQQQQEEEEEEEEEEEREAQPFDYSKASSVLHAHKGAAANGGSGGYGGGGKGKRGGHNKPAFDPYAKKSGDAPAGARKMNYEKGGRTHTFKK
ncbi:ribonuclease H-like domain-containing protein [Chaetomidium leptoderma]|uniref:Ribonuclease H-like domain-containing protein n=1 Tax=Chaetomidium leptoderma TaxID=669021 RepID=A0AAN6VMM2_9PEZI|nr:ribonuclease H-like domain-containing protein [Chaetomidium leptoderma]